MKRKPKTPSLSSRLLSLALQHPRRILGTLILGGCGTYIAWNALVLQTAHHPAPLFNQSPEAPQAAQPLPAAHPMAAPSQAQAETAPQTFEAAPAPAASPSVAVPMPPSRSAITDLIRNNGQPGAVSQPSPRAAPAPAPAPPAKVAAAPSRAPLVRDPIAEIIRMGGPVPMPPANVGHSDNGDVVLSGQRALAKLGFNIKVDGIMGSETRHAIERFEQDRNLPVTGELNARTIRELSAASGIAVP
ncbi:peptidoglycan-binding domain-containing protein [Microvirga lenta]|uniref:peptidoglycan-binding domain-containing protein n=1 Tax=Microvirga lenta TaxID=2881337 RepID=UPI001CFFDF87|nr:peptidoglycan-binding domain-containing protein [Microvirga lenta]MCB5176319.1 peptidoglycan-binding protein [Microvirga lenta]